jgi:hypothetical protein
MLVLFCLVSILILPFKSRSWLEFHSLLLHAPTPHVAAHHATAHHPALWLDLLGLLLGLAGLGSLLRLSGCLVS